MITISLVSCSKAKVEDVGPRVSDGSYVATESDATVAAIVIKRNPVNGLDTYALLSYDCGGAKISNFGAGGTVFSATASSVPTPSIHDLSNRCDVETSAIASSNDSITVLVKLNGLAQKPELLTKSDSATALSRIHDAFKSSDKTKSYEASCSSAFGGGCSDLGLDSH